MKVEFSLNCSGIWTDYSDSVDASKIKIVKTLDEQKDPQKTTTGEIECWGAAYTFLYANLISSVNLYSNAVCVQVTDTDCNVVHQFKLETKQLKWCLNEECKMTFNLVEYNEQIDCIKRTTIADNTNGDYQTYPVSGIPHPKFRYCDVIKPTFFFGFILTFLNSIDLLILSLNIVLFTVFNPVFIVLNAFFGTSFVPPQVAYVGPLLVGCNRVFPAPFIRSYIDNVCTVCGGNVTVDSTSCIPFFDPVSIYYNTCLLTAYTTKGVKLSETTKDYIVANQPSWSLHDLMSKLKAPFNARWFLKDLGAGNYKLHFSRKDLLSIQLWGAIPTIDLSLTGGDRKNLIGDVCFSWNGESKPSRINMNYSNDAGDNIGNELLCRFNGEYISPSNPNYNTPVERRTLDFGVPSFILDGKDTLWDANLQQSVGAVLSGTDYGGVLKTQGDTLQLAKLIIYDDGTPIDDARPIADDWTTYSGIAAFGNDEGGFFPINATELSYYNYAMSFDPDAWAINNLNLWGFHQIDIPTSGKKTNIAFEYTLQFCCPYTTGLELYMRTTFENGDVGEIDYIEYNKETQLINVKGNLI